MWKAAHAWLLKVLRRKSARGPARVGVIALGMSGQNRILLENLAARNPWDLRFTSTLPEAWDLLNRLKAPVILCDRDLEGTEWRDVVRKMASSPHNACTILISRVVDEYLWTEVNVQGGYDVLSKPLREEDVTRSIKLASSYWNTSHHSQV